VSSYDALKDLQFHAIQSGDQYVFFCNSGEFRVLCYAARLAGSWLLGPLASSRLFMQPRDYLYSGDFLGEASVPDSMASGHDQFRWAVTAVGRDFFRIARGTGHTQDV